MSASINNKKRTIEYDVNKRVVEILHMIRKVEDISNDEFLRKAQFSKSTLLKIDSMSVNPSQDNLKSYAKALGIKFSTVVKYAEMCEAIVAEGKSFGEETARGKLYSFLKMETDETDPNEQVGVTF